MDNLLEQAAFIHSSVGSLSPLGSKERFVSDLRKESFILGSQWQKEQYSQLITLINSAMFSIGFEEGQLAEDIQNELERLQIGGQN